MSVELVLDLPAKSWSNAFASRTEEHSRSE
jgi:hypothetical protein